MGQRERERETIFGTVHTGCRARMILGAGPQRAHGRLLGGPPNRRATGEGSRKRGAYFGRAKRCSLTEGTRYRSRALALESKPLFEFGHWRLLHCRHPTIARSVPATRAINRQSVCHRGDRSPARALFE